MKRIVSNMRGPIFVYVIMTIILAIFMVSESLLLQRIIDTANLKNYHSYVTIAIITVIFLIIQTCIYYYQQYLTSVLSKKAAMEYRKRWFEKIAVAKLDSIVRKDKGELLSQMTVQVDALQTEYFYTLFWGGYLLCQFAIAVGIVFYVNSIIAITVMLLCVPNLFVATLFKYKLQNNQEGLMLRMNQYVSKVDDLVSGIGDWKKEHDTQFIQAQFEKATDDLFKQQKKADRFQYSIISLNQFFSNFLFFGSWLVGAYFIISGNLSLGAMVAFSQLLIRIAFPVHMSSDLIPKYINGRKIYRVLEASFNEISSGIHIDEINEIRLEAFSIYSTTANQLQPVSGVFKKGEKYLIKGESGIGKSSLFRAILKEQETYSGSILIDNINVKEINEVSLFNAIAYVPQKPHIFSATLQENITLFNDSIPTENILTVLKQVGLEKWANDESLQLLIGAGNVNISGGEQKRIALARALLKPHSFLLIDEFSSGIDSNTLKDVEERLLELKVGVLYVTHLNNIDFENQFDKKIYLS